MINLKAVPDKPGCYLFKDGDGKVLYVGKAKDLKKRVSSYFQKRDKDAKTEAMLKNVASLDFIVTDSDVEAFILENNLIKKNSPKYNIDLRDAKRYAYIRLTDEPFPRLLLSRKRDGKGEYFGPFVSGEERDYVLAVLKKAFKLRTCKRLPKKACMRESIGLCLAPCLAAGDNDIRDSYAEAVKAVRAALSGKMPELAKAIEAEMKRESLAQNYERAKVLKERLDAVKHLGERQRMERGREYDEDVVNYQIRNGTVYLMLFNVAKGMLENKREFEFSMSGPGSAGRESAGFLTEFLAQYYSENPVPKEVIVPEPLEPGMAEYLSGMRGSNVAIIVPQKGDKKHLLDLVGKNVELSFFGGERRMADLRERLDLEKLPAIIECFDVSHLSGTSNVASMVQFRNGRPDMGNYRRFKIRGFVGADDFRSIGEVVKRRYSRLVDEKSQMPDLILIDGGKGQLNAALGELKKLGLEREIPVISIAKEFEEVYVPGGDAPIRLGEKTDALKLLQEIRDEAHRFAIAYNRLLRKKGLTA